jgi:membrane protease YdiL (CAAX protease family)
MMEQLFFSTEHRWASFLTVVIVAPLTEEMLFRGVILRGFLQKFSAFKAILVSSLLFAFIHLNPWQFFSALGLGLACGWWYMRARSLIPVVLCHALANLIVFGHRDLPFEVRGFNVGGLTDPVEFHPLWFNGLGILLVVGGLWLFHRVTPAAVRHAASRAEPPPLPERI